MCLRILTTHKYLMQNNSIKTAASHSGFWFRVNSYMLLIGHCTGPVSGTDSGRNCIVVRIPVHNRWNRRTSYSFTVKTVLLLKGSVLSVALLINITLLIHCCPLRTITSSENNTGNSPFKAIKSYIQISLSCIRRMNNNSCTFIIL